MDQLNGLIAFEIKTEEHYKLAVAICPYLSEIPFEAVEGHFFGLTEGKLRFATIPPGAIPGDIMIENAPNTAQLLQFVKQ